MFAKAFLVLITCLLLNAGESIDHDIKSTVDDLFHVGSTTAESGPTHHLHGVENFQITLLDPPKPSKREKDLDRNLKSLPSRTPFGSQIQISFTINGETTSTHHDLTLDLHHDLFDETATYRSTDEKETRKQPIPNHAYKASIRDKKGNGPELGWIRATIVNENEAHIYLLDYLQGDLLVVEPTSNVLTHSPDHPDIRRLSKLGHKMVAYMHDADAHDSHQKSEAFVRMRRLVQEHSVRNAHPLMRTKNVQRRQRHLALMPPWLRNSIGVYKGEYGRMSGTSGGTTVNCPAIQQRMKIGIACDAGFYEAIAGSSTSNAANDLKVVVLITNIMNVANVLYTE